MGSRMRTGSSFWADFIRWQCIFPSVCSCWFRCSKLPGHFRPALREAAGFVLGLALRQLPGRPGAWISARLRQRQTPVRAVTRHMWGGIALTIGVLSVPAGAAVVVIGQCAARLSGTVACMLWCWLVDGPPGRLADARQQLSDRIHAGAAETRAGSRLAFRQMPGRRVILCKAYQPDSRRELRVLSWRGKEKGGLRLDSYELLMKGGKDGRGRSFRAILKEPVA